jgi:preprotein translocase subunit YajC
MDIMTLLVLIPVGIALFFLTLIEVSYQKKERKRQNELLDRMLRESDPRYGNKK